MIESDRERLIRWEDPAPTAEAARRMSGLEFLRAIVKGDIPAPPIARLMGFWISEAEEGRAVFESDPSEFHYNPIGLVHGGLALTMLDSALGCAVQTTLPAGTGYATTDVQVRMVRPITKATGRIRCEATVVHTGRTTAIAEGRLYDAQRKILAIGSTACAIIRPAS